jgi:hypothetical protein
MVVIEPDAGAREVPDDEVPIRLVALHAIGLLLVRARDLQRRRQPRAAEHVVGDVDDRRVVVRTRGAAERQRVRARREDDRHVRLALVRYDRLRFRDDAGDDAPGTERVDQLELRVRADELRHAGRRAVRRVHRPTEVVPELRAEALAALHTRQLEGAAGDGQRTSLHRRDE